MPRHPFFQNIFSYFLQFRQSVNISKINK
ncbi:hypothetical protein PFNF54_01901 [Plasmodium falciparum NF54]|uniref:Uncharacterized protein n=1 Tax=Plasmodium falciparum (isolate NF54) TaxID=5843 RepID=W7KII0_PLAFO|nr:hypothetical protein PFNF54_01901 [Plasmodium falciparum NF54]